MNLPYPSHAPACGKRYNTQGGLILITSLIMIVMLTLVILTSLSVSLATVGISKNVDNSMAARAASQSSIETIINDPGFLANPTAVGTTPLTVDSNSDGVADYTVTMTAACVGSRPVLLSELNTALAADAVCIKGGSEENAGIVSAAGTITGVSLCSDTRWNIKGISARTNAADRAEVNQGVAVRMPLDDSLSFCK